MKAILILLFLAVTVEAQTVIREVVNVTSDPSGATCARNRLYKNTVNNTLWQRNSVSGQCEQITGGAAGAPTNATYITQTPNATLSAEQALSALSTGIMRVATTTGAVTSLTDSAGIAANISDESGTDKLVFSAGPTFSGSVTSTGTNSITGNSAASTPGLLLSGNWFTGGSSTTTKPHFLVEQSGAVTNNWSTNGTGIGVNAPSAFGGNLLDLQVNGAGKLNVDQFGQIVNPAGGGGIHWVNAFSIGYNNSSFDIQSDWPIRWSNNASTIVTLDTGLSRNAAGVVEVNNGTEGGLGKMLAARVVTAKTTGYTVLSADKSTFFTNTGAGAGVTFTLPTPVVGMTYEFYRDANQTVTIDIAAGVTIRVGASVTTDGGNATLDAVGSRLRIVAISTTQWVGDISGTVTFN